MDASRNFFGGLLRLLAMRSLVCLLALALVPAVFAQPDAQLAFEVASVKLSPPANGGGRTVGCSGGPDSPDPDRWSCQNLNLKNLLGMAEGLNFFQIQGPDWLFEPYFNINAILPKGTTRKQFQAMIESLLKDRFHLASHRESREMPVLALVVAKGGPKIKEGVETPLPEDAKNDPPYRPTPDKDGFPALRPGRPGMAMMRGGNRMYYPALTMDGLAGMLGLQMGKQTTNATGLIGKYEISLYWVSDNSPAHPDADGPRPTLEEAIQSQLGLRFETRKGAIEFLIVDHIDKLPTDN